MRVVFIGGPRHREEQMVMFGATVEIGEYKRWMASEPAAQDKDWWDVELCYFVPKTMNPEEATIAVHKHLRDERESLH